MIAKAPALPVVHLVDEGVYLVEPRGSCYGQKYEVAGLPMPGTSFTVVDLKDLVRVRQLPKQISHWAAEDGAQLTVEEYNTQKATLRRPDGFDEGGKFTFDSLEDEFAWRKFHAKWTAVYKPAEEVREAVECEVVEVRTNSGDPDIVSLWNAPNVSGDRRLYSLNRPGVATAVLYSLCAKYGLELDIPSHSGIRFAKVDGKYIFDANFEYKQPAFIGTREACLVEKASIIKAVTGPVKAAAAAKRGAAIPNAGAALAQATLIAKYLASVHPKRGCEAALSTARTSLRTMIEGLQAAVDEGLEK